MKGITSILLFCLLIPFSGISQTKELDSLNAIFPASKGKDRVDIQISIARKVYKTDKEKSESYFKEAEALARSINYKEGIIDAVYYSHRSKDLAKDYTNALPGYKSALKMAQDLGDRKRIAMCYLAIGKIHGRMNHYMEDILTMDEALAWVKNDEYEFRGDFHAEKGFALFYTGDYTKAKYNFEEAYTMRIKSGNEADAAGVYMNLGVMTYRMGKAEESLPYYQVALKSFKKQKDTVNIGHALVNIAMSEYAMGKIDDATRDYQRAGEMYLAINDRRNFTYVLSNITNLYIDQGQYGKAYLAQMDALKQYEKDGDRKGIAGSYAGISQVNLHMKDTAKALEYLEKAIAINQELGILNSLAGNLVAKGNILSERKQFTEANACYQQAMLIRTKNGDKGGVAGSHLSIGNNFYRQQQLDSAVNRFTTALNIFIELGEKQNIAGLHSNIGVVYYEKGDYNKALEHYEKAYEIRKELGFLQDIGETYLTFANVYDKLGKYEEALKYHRLYFKQWDSLYSESNKRTIAEMQTKYETDKKEKEIALLSAESQMKEYALEKQFSLLEMERLKSDKANQELTLAQQLAKLQEIQLEQSEKDKAIQAKELEDEKQRSKLQEEINAQQKKITSYFIGGFIFMLITSLIIFRFYRQNRKAKLVITEQKKEVEKQKAEAELQKIIVEEKNKEITDSIRYAQRLQNAILPPINMFEKMFSDFMVLYKPKDIVAGDFYWLAPFAEATDTKGLSRDGVLFAVADCTGHGVPGAMVSVVGHNSLERCIKEFKLSSPEKILDKLNDLVVGTFSKSEDQVSDGMDISLCAISQKDSKKVLEYSGANNPVWIVRSGEIIEIKADKQPIGRFDYRQPFSLHEVELQKDDVIYLFSDGFADQFGGPSGKKFKYSKMKEELIKICQQPLQKQQRLLSEVFENWKGHLEQVDDVCLIGVRID